MSQPYTYGVTLTWYAGDTDTVSAQLEIECSYRVDWGAPERGPTYASGGQPADPPMVTDIRILAVGGKSWPVFDLPWGFLTAHQDHAMLVDKLEAECLDEMLSDAAAEEADIRDQAAQDRFEAMREEMIEDDLEDGAW